MRGRGRRPANGLAAHGIVPGPLEWKGAVVPSWPPSRSDTQRDAGARSGCEQRLPREGNAVAGSVPAAGPNLADVEPAAVRGDVVTI